MNIFTRDLGFPEAPVVLPDGSFLFVEMTPEKGCVIHVSADGASRKVIAKTGRPNGLARDRNGAIWVAETEQRALLKLDLDGSYDTVATSAGDERFLFLNDLAFAPNGELFLTDSGILHDDFMKGGQFVPNYRDLKYDGRVYRVDTRTKRAEILDRGFKFTNGIAFGPDQALYVAETLSGNIYRYASRDGRIVGQARAVRQRHRALQSRRAQGPGRYEVRCRRQPVCVRVRAGRCHGARSQRRGDQTNQNRRSVLHEPRVQGQADLRH